MGRSIKKGRLKPGLPPGALVHVGERKEGRAKITLIDYDEAGVREKELRNIEESFPFKDLPSVTWINIDGLHETGIIEKIGKHFEVHPLVLEDILTTDQRPKMEDFEKYTFIVLKMIRYDEGKNEITSEQISIILGMNYVISFQELEGDTFDHIRDWIRTGKGRLRRMGSDYLSYALLDSIVDHYFTVLERLGEKIEEMEDVVLGDPTPESLQTIHALKREMTQMRKSVWPLREVVNRLERSESPLIQDSTKPYLRDVYDHTIQVIDTIETYRDLLSGLLDLYLSSISNRMNEVMKVLTIIATIFIPLTFIAGIYGMNFSPSASRWNMPELNWRFGYPAVLFLMLLIGFSMTLYFRRKKWL